MISTVLFDADGVLINSKMSSEYFAEKYGLDSAKTREFYEGPFVDCLVGKKDMLKELPVFLEKWGWHKTVDDFVSEWFEFEHKVNKSLLSDIETLRASGIKCYVATNQEKHRAEYMLSAMGFGRSFDGLFASAHLGSKKPDHEFFHKILKKLHISEPATVLFWDDSEENITAAKEVGLLAELFTDYKSYRMVMSAHEL
jgi:putative hydrolase of the HAD superfamily